ncbi:MAG: hypothetical protein IJO74_01895 [Clostridia bacterium]|nr:hypothetical protein [Clostridia bacterium]
MGIALGKVHISIVSFIPVAVLLLFNPPEYVFAMLFCALLHETGHLVAMRVAGVSADRVDILLFGAKIKMNGYLGYGTDMLIYASGAIANLMAALSAYVIYFNYQSTIVMFVIISNIFYALFNMLPIRGLDGGEFLECLLMNYFHPYTAWKTCVWVSYIFTLLLSVISLWLISISGTNFSLFFITLSLFMGIESEKG